MPHCIIEYAAPIAEECDIDDLCLTVHKAALASELFSEPAIKTRAVPLNSYTSGGEKKRYVHCSVKLLAGRTMDQKNRLGHIVKDALHGALPQIDAISVEVIDLAESYYK